MSKRLSDSGGIVELSEELRATLPEVEAAAVRRLMAHYPEVRWAEASRFSFRPPRMVRLGRAQPHYAMLAAHEVGHCLMGHRDFRTEVGRLRMESEAWERAHAVWSELRLEERGAIWDEEFVEDQLDTYREWLHSKSLCPRCGQVRFQTVDGAFHCLFCGEYTLTGTE